MVATKFQHKNRIDANTHADGIIVNTFIVYDYRRLCWYIASMVFKVMFCCSPSTDDGAQSVDDDGEK